MIMETLIICEKPSAAKRIAQSLADDDVETIKDLGITSLWITPIFKHNGSYHGYCTTDFSDIDPGFGTREEFRLIHKAVY